MIAQIHPDDEQICLGQDENLDENAGAVMPPIVQTSLFRKGTLRQLQDELSEESKNYVYTRGQNPTVAVLEDKLAALERGEACKCFASGMAAVSAALTGLLKQGDHILFVNHIYGPTLKLAQHLTRFGIEHTHTLELDSGKIESELLANTRMIYFENPGTMMFRLVDIQKLAALAKKHNILTVIDNTWATPLFQKPLTHGVDISVHSCTKYIGGHSDVVAGAVITNKELMAEIFRGAYMLNGGILAPFDAWLLIRGLRTLPVRLKQHHKDALVLAKNLKKHPRIKNVYHPALQSATLSLAKRYFTGYSGLFSIELNTDKFKDICRFVDSLQLFHKGVSWGGVESLVISPNRGDNQQVLQKLQLPPGLVRLSVGLEGAEMLTDDIMQALTKL